MLIDNKASMASIFDDLYRIASTFENCPKFKRSVISKAKVG
jgi:hypothetical protein